VNEQGDWRGPREGTGRCMPILQGRNFALHLRGAKDSLLGPGLGYFAIRALFWLEGVALE
jgi:hypothetical protein